MAYSIQPSGFWLEKSTQNPELGTLHLGSGENINVTIQKKATGFLGFSRLLQTIKNLLTPGFTFFSHENENIGVSNQYKKKAKHAFECMKTILPPSAEKIVHTPKPFSPTPQSEAPRVSPQPPAFGKAPLPQKPMSKAEVAEIVQQPPVKAATPLQPVTAQVVSQPPAASGKPPPPPTSDPVKEFKLAAELPQSAEKTTLSLNLYEHVNRKSDPATLEAAIKRCKAAAEQQDTIGCYACSELGDYYQLHSTPPKLQEAEMYYRKGFGLAKDIEWKGVFCSRLANNLDKQGRYDEALDFYTQSADEFKVDGARFHIARYMLEEIGGAKKDIDEIIKQLRACCFGNTPASLKEDAKNSLISLIAKPYINNWDEEKEALGLYWIKDKKQFIQNMDQFVQELKKTSSYPLLPETVIDVPVWLSTKLIELELEKFQETKSS